MKIEDLGFITYIKKYEENSLLIKIISKENGLISGYLTHIKKDKNLYQVGNLVKFNWSAKNTNQLGNFKIELYKSYLSIFFSSKFYLYLIEAINLLINNLLYERLIEDKLFIQLHIIFDLLLENQEKNIILKEYLIFENLLLNIIGTGIIFEDSNENLEEFYYISPKTGLAVNKEKGEPYKDRLFIFPTIFKNNIILNEDIFECFDVLEFFLKKHLRESNMEYKYKNIILVRNNLKLL